MTATTTRIIRTDADARVALSVTTHLTDSQAATICAGITTNNFARSLAADYRKYGRLFPNKLAWMHKLALAECKPAAVQTPTFATPAAPAATPAPVPPPVFFKRIADFLTPASNTLKSGASVTVAFHGRTIEIKRATANSTHAGAFWVTDGRPYGSNTLYGRINRDGQFVAYRAMSGADGSVVDACLREMDADPAGFCAAMGKRSGRCCFCTLPLEDETSVLFGYGPVCAKHYGLPHGKRAAAKVVAMRCEAAARVNATDPVSVAAIEEHDGEAAIDHTVNELSIIQGELAAAF